MTKIEVKSDRYCICRFTDGVIVSLMNINNAISYASQIHNVVSKNSSNDLFASDLADMIDCPENIRVIICKTLFVYSDKGVSISGSNIRKIHARNQIEIQHDGEVFLVIKNRRCAILKLLLLAIFSAIILTVFNINNDAPVSSDVVQADNGITKSQTVNTDKENLTLPSISDRTLRVDKQNENQKESIIGSTKTVATKSMIAGDLTNGRSVSEDAQTTDITPGQDNYKRKLEDNYKVEDRSEATPATHYDQNIRSSKVNNSNSNTVAAYTSSKSKTDRVPTEASTYLRQAESAYNQYIITLDEVDGINALLNYEETMKYIEYLPDEKEKIIKRIKILKEVIN